MPAEIVIVKHKQQHQKEEQLQTKPQHFCVNLCAPLPCSGVDVNAAAIRNTSNAADVDVAATEPAAATLTAWQRRSRRRQLRSAKAASTFRTVIIIMALVFSIMQQQQHYQQQQWPFYIGKYALFIKTHNLHLALSYTLVANSTFLPCRCCCCCS